MENPKMHNLAIRGSMQYLFFKGLNTFKILTEMQQKIGR